MSVEPYEFTLLDRLLLHLASALESVLDLSDDEMLDLFTVAAGIGTLPNSDRNELIDLATDLSNAIDEALSNSEEFDYSSIIAIAVPAASLFRKLAQLSSLATNPEPMLGEALGFFLAGYLRRELPGAAAILSFLGVLEDSGSPWLIDLEEEEDESGTSSGDTDIADPMVARFHLSRFATLLRNPAEWAEQVYKWESGFDFAEFEARAYELMVAAGVDASPFESPSAASAGGNVYRELRIVLVRTGEIDASYGELGLAISPAPPGPSGNAGFYVTVYLFGELEAKLIETDEFVVTLDTSLQLAQGLSLLFEPNLPPVFLVGIGEHGGDVGTGSLALTAKQKVLEEHSLLRLAGAYISSSGESLRVELHGDLTDPALRITLDIEQLAVGIDTTDGDSFLSSIVSLQAEVVFDLTVGWSSKDGFFLGGSLGFELTLPLHLMIGPIRIDEIILGIEFGLDDMGLSFYALASIGFELGPVSGVVTKLGVGSAVSFDGKGESPFSNLAFIPPLGAGFSVAAEGLIGAGFLELDRSNHRYAGILGLTFGEIGLTAIGLITTRMPDGSEGYAILISIGVTFDPPIQLMAGFVLAGVGGLMGINRSMDIEVLQTGIRNRTLDSILFPDPSTVVANANKIISDLRAVFPPTSGHFVIGPMVKIGYGSPPFITADIGIFIELTISPFEIIRVVLMGQVEANLPEAEEAIVVIHLDVLGVLDFPKQQLTFQASLYDSRILEFSLQGDSAFLLRWGNDPQFGLSLGGFHPKFTPPPPPIIFADLRRLSLNLSSGSEIQLSCEAYQALTPNSLQFGARLDLHASYAGAVIDGYLGFDSLFYFSPFSFEVTISGGVHIAYEGVSLVDVDLWLILSGPTPWNARGQATIKLLFFEVDVDFEITWGPDTQVTLDAIDPWDQLQAALSLPSSWGSQLPPGRKIVESLRELDDQAEDLLVVHPGGRLEVSQNVVPLAIRLTKMGNAPVTGHDRFTIASLNANGVDLEPEPVEEFFARGQFESLTNQQKLSLPSFEKMQGGATTSAADVVTIGGQNSMEEKALGYESILIRPDRSADDPKPGEAPWSETNRYLKTNAARQAQKRAGPHQQFTPVRAQPQILVGEDSYCIARAEDLTRAELAGETEQANQNLTRVLADQLLSTHLEIRPEDVDQLFVVPEYEVVG